MNREFQITITIKSDTIQQAKEGIKEKFKNVSEIKCLEKRRSSLQNRALHLYFTLLATALNDAGYDMRKTIKQDIDIIWSGKMVKEYLWRPIQKTYLQEKSTTRLKTGDIDKVYDILNKAIGERCGVYVPFPSIDNLIDVDYN